MGWLDGLRHAVAPEHGPLLHRHETPEEETFDAWTEHLYALIEERRSSFTLTQALSLPPVMRGVQLLASTAASFLPLVYRAGAALPDQPRLVRKPDPFMTRYAFVYALVEQLVATRHGDAFLLHVGGTDGLPDNLVLLPSDECEVEWRRRPLVRAVKYAGTWYTIGQDVTHIAIGRRPGELRGRGPVWTMLDYLYPVHAAETFAGDFFASGGVPSTVLQSDVALDATEAQRLKAQYMDSSVQGVRVASGGIKAAYPTINPQAAQMQESRAYGATVVSRGLGIPGSLLHAETSGSTIVYQNAHAAIEELVKATVAPTYLAPIEQALSELVPGSDSVRFDLAELQRADMAARFGIYGDAIANGIMDATEARAFEGWGPLGTAVDTAHTYDPTPAPEPAGVPEPMATEVLP